MRKYHSLSIISIAATWIAFTVLTPFSGPAAQRTPTYSATMPIVTTTPTPKDAYLLPAIQELVVPNEKCRLPCFLNLTPGKTQVNEIQESVRNNFNGKSLGNARVVNDKDFFYLVLELVTSDEPSLAVEFEAEQDLLSLMTVDMDMPFKWLPENIFDLAHTKSG